MADQETGDLWLFGYGSLIWKPPPHYGMEFQVRGDDSGLIRFKQTSEYLATSKTTFAAFGSQDHRGTPEAPGRVVTLIDRQLWETLTDEHASAPPRVWGAAYRIPANHVKEAKEYLDIREINGYSIQYTPFNQDMSATMQTVHTAHDSTSSGNTPKQIQCLVYIGLPDNPQFLGPQDPQALAEHIVRSRGPSGENKDYLYQLETALNGLSEGSEDEHISDLARRCRDIEAAGKKP
ncbi:hypothetical protein LTR78_004465 [Recurvomyces mirabilis]|uniref:glutathione-specific gamma-glutamylcyclotransferase n=1 Tax=Recurvomyces mirabilis TaxID=574656 RepID=A0AAE0WQ74_9PEZI|nr:hypothetical protein LTR78_004465 [Recurvomyces mirabilis]KAK5155869.1 hypothetical protein LTS14_005435 [Recurvomyces mirabilis]